MKKALFLPLFASLLLVLPSCNGSSEQPYLAEVKALLSKQDLSPAYHKIFSTEFIQNYDLFSSRRGESAESLQFHSYRGGGAFGCAYEVAEDAYQEALKEENPDFFSFLARGEGGYGLVQSARVVSYHYEKDGDDRALEPLRDINFLQMVQANFSPSDVQVASNFIYSQGIDGSNPRFQSFNGSLPKETLFSTVSVRSLSDLFARTNLYDGQRTCESLDQIYEATLLRLSKADDKALSAFIAENHITVEEADSNTLVHFELGEETLLSALEETEIIPGTLKGTLTYDQATGSFEQFEYRVAYYRNDVDESSGELYSASMEFSAKGYSKNEEFEGDIYITPDPVVYEDGESFLKDMVEGIIPQLI